MKSGKKLPKIETSAHIHPAQYAQAHREEGCKGGWKFAIQGPVTITLNGLGATRVSAAAFVTCDTCKAAYFAPKYQEFVEKVIARQLILSRELLDKKQLRFLRMHFGLTQDDLAKRIGITDRHALSHMESESSTKSMGVDKQFRLKVFYAKLMGIDPENIYQFLDMNDEKFHKLHAEKLFSEDDIKSLIRKKTA